MILKILLIFSTGINSFIKFLDKIKIIISLASIINGYESSVILDSKPFLLRKFVKGVSQSFESRLRFLRRIFIFTQGWEIQRYKNRCCKMKISRRPAIRFLRIHLAECTLSALADLESRSLTALIAAAPVLLISADGTKETKMKRHRRRLTALSLPAITINRLIPEAAR